MKNHPLSLPTVSIKICLSIILFLLPFFSFAQLGKYEFASDTTKIEFYQVTSQPAHATFSNFRLNGAKLSLGKGVLNTKSWISKTIDYSRYVEFTISAHAGYSLNLSHLQFESSRSNKGPTQARVAHNASGNFTTDYLDFTPNDSILQKTTWDFPDIKTPLGGSVTFRIYGLLALEGRGAYRMDNVAMYGTVIPQLSINEFHYANTSTTKTGFVEVVAPKDFTELNTATLSLYNSEGKVYKSYTLDKFKFLPDAIYGNSKYYYLDIPEGLVEGNGGFSLSSGGHVIQFLSYGGTITAVGGPAINLTSEDIEVTETEKDGAYNSIALMPNETSSFNASSDDESAATIWEKGNVDNNTKGYSNTDPYQVLPVELVSFQAKTKTEEVVLSWVTATEINNKEFVIERSVLDDLNFKTIGKVNGHGTTLQQQQYEFIDSNPVVGTSYYRLKQIDLDGTTTYSKVLAITRKTLITTTMRVYPNPATEFINVATGNLIIGEQLLIQVVNLQGKVMYEQMHQYSNKSQDLNIPLTALPAGSYYLVLMKDGKKEAKAFLKGN